jgi:hypothetical protein
VSIAAAGGSSDTSATFTAALRGDSASASYRWQYLSVSGSPQTVPGSGPSVSITFPGLGSYVVWATATDATGNTIVGATRVALPLAAPPTASFTYAPAAPLTGSPVTLDGSASTCPSTPCSYTWSDDGSPTRPTTVLYPLGSGQTLQFTFQDAGTKYVRVVITDALGRSATVEHDVVVSAPPPTGPPATAPSPGTPSSSAAGSTAAASGTAGAGTSPSGAVSTLGSSASGLIAPSPAQLRALLSSLLTAHGKTAKITSLLRHGGYSLQWSAPSAGRLTVSWYATGARGRLILIATASRSFARPATARIILALTAAGERLLRSSHSLMVRATASFAPEGHPATTAQKSFTLAP